MNENNVLIKTKTNKSWRLKQVINDIKYSVLETGCTF